MSDGTVTFRTARNINLDNFDESGKSNNGLNSPRSLEACDRMGVEPEELICRNAKWVMDRMTPEQERLPGFTEARVKHYDKCRLKKLALVRAERDAIINGTSSFGSGGHDGLGGMDPVEEAKQKAQVMLAANKKEISKMQQRQLKKMNAMIKAEVVQMQTSEKITAKMHTVEERLAFERAEKQRIIHEKLEHLDLVQQEKRRLEKAKEEAAAAAAEAHWNEAQRIKEARDEEARQRVIQKQMQALQREESAAARKKELEVIREKQRQETAARQQMMLEKEEKRSYHLAMEQERIKNENMEAMRRKEARLLANKIKQDAIMAERIRMFDEKERRAVEKRELFNEKRRQENEENHRKAQEKEQSIQAAINQANKLLEDKNEAYRLKEEKRQQRADERREEERQQHLKHLDDLAQRQEDRKNKLQNSRDKERSWIENTIKKGNARFEKASHAHDQRSRDIAAHKLDEELIKLEKQEYFKRKWKMKEYKNKKLKQKLDHDSIRTREMKAQYANVRRERKVLQDKAAMQNTAMQYKFQEFAQHYDLHELDPRNIDVRTLGLVDADFGAEDGELPPVNKTLLSPRRKNSPPKRSQSAIITKKPHTRTQRAPKKPMEESKEQPTTAKSTATRNDITGYDEGKQAMVNTQKLGTLKKPLSARLGKTKRRTDNYGDRLSRTVDGRGYFSAAAM